MNVKLEKSESKNGFGREEEVKSWGSTGKKLMGFMDAAFSEVCLCASHSHAYETYGT